MDKSFVLIILGTAHRMREPGKCSPDGRLKECIYSRELCKEIAAKLKASGYKVEIDFTDLDLSKTMQSPSVSLERSRELAMRVNYVNELYRQNSSKNVIYVSIHVNASPPVDNKWHPAKGWQVCVSTQASQKSKTLAKCLYDAAEKQGLKMRKPTSTQKYWSQSLYVLNKTNCPAVLTENLFQDNKEDVDFLLSEKGRQAIVDLHVEGIKTFVEKV